MPLDPIQRRDITDPERAAYQERTARAVETNPEPFLAAYQARANTHGGRYVAADMMKEVFPEFSASREGRTRYNVPLHNSAAVLASEQFRRAVADTSHPERNTAIFLTGIPGAGKTSAILDNQQLPPHVRVAYEGQLANPGPAIQKIQTALDAGLKVEIVAIHIKPEVALENTFGRFEKEGRGAGYVAMASVQGNLPDGLTAIREHFGNRVNLTIIDRRDGMNAAKELAGWRYLDELRSEGNYEHIKQRLIAAIDRHEAGGKVSAGAIREARGLPPLARDNRLHRAVDPQPEHPSAGSATRPERGELPAAGVQPGAVTPGQTDPPSATSPTSFAGTQGPTGSQPATVRFAERDCTIVADPPRGSAAPSFRLHDVQTGKEIVKITTQAAQRDPSAGCVHVKNHGEHAGLADALARSGAFEKGRDLLGGMVVEMKVKDPTLQPHIERHQQAQAKPREVKPAKSLRREGPTLERD